MEIRYSKAEKTRTLIINTARKHFCIKGIEQGNVHDIVDKLDISQRTLYRYFPSKDILLKEIYLATISRFNQMYKINILLEMVNKQNSSQILKTYYDVIRHIAKTEPELLLYDLLYNCYALERHEDPLNYPEIRSIHNYDTHIDASIYKNITVEFIRVIFSGIQKDILLEFQKEVPDMNELIIRWDKIAANMINNPFLDS